VRDYFCEQKIKMSVFFRVKNILQLRSGERTDSGEAKQSRADEVGMKRGKTVARVIFPPQYS
jgi:hypothetical protein